MKKVLKFLGKHFKHIDKVIPVICIGLTIFNVFLVNSMVKPGFVNEHVVKTQLAAGILGICASLVISFIDYKFISKCWFIIAPAAVILQLLVWTPLGRRRDDDLAWLEIGPINIQPSEILKFVFIITLATHIHKLGDKINSPKHLLLLLAHGLFPAALIIIQGDAGSALVFLFIFIVMIFAAGISWKYIAVGIACVPPILYVAWNFVMQDHHRKRILILFDKEMQEAERLGDYMQQYEGTVCLGSGQLKGLGFTNTDSYHWTFEINNDYVFSYIGMTMGFIGCMAVVLVLMVLCLKILSDASGAQDKLGKMICTGVFALLFFHCVINIGMVLSVIPVIGIPLPFISTGGTAMLMMHVCMGLVLSVSAHKEKEKHMFYTEKD